MAAVKFAIHILSATRQRRRFPRALLVSADWHEIRYGGFADFTLETSARFNELSAIVPTDLVEIFLDNVLRFRGEIYGLRRQEQEPDKLTITGYGRLLRVGAHIAIKNYLYPRPVDISTAIRNVVSDFVETQETTPLAVRVTPTGLTIQNVNAYIKMTKDVFNDITKFAGNQATWGVDLVTDPADAAFGLDRFFLRPVSQGVDWVIPARAKSAGSLDFDREADKVINNLFIVGGTPRYPNLLYNGSFERPIFAGGLGGGNILNSPGFEDRSNWSLISTASYKSAGLSEGGAYEGSNMIELDNVGEGFHQTRDNNAQIIPGHDYTFGGQFRRERGTDIVAADLTITWRDAAHATISTSVLSHTTLAPPDATWRFYYMTDRAPALAAGFDFQVVMTLNAGTGNGMVCDAMEFYDSSIARQDHWDIQTFGSAQVISQNWLSPNAFQGGYCYFINQTSADMNNEDIHLYQNSSYRFDVTGNQGITFQAHFMIPPGFTTSPKMFLEVHTFRSDGSECSGPIRYPIPAGFFTPGVGWQSAFTSLDCASDAVKAEAYITFRGSGAMMIDAVCVRDTAAYDGANPDAFYIPDGPLQVKLSAANLFTDDALHISEQQSESVYGVRSEIINEQLLTTVEDAISYAKSYFIGKATPPLAPAIELVEDHRIFAPGQGVRLVGVNGAAVSSAPLPIVRINHRYDGQYHVSLELEREQPDNGDIILNEIQLLMDRQNGTSGSPGLVGTSQGTSAAGIGSGSGSGSFWGTSARSASDSTLHDAYLPAGGPHIVPAERTQFNATAGEVVAARTRTVAAISYLSLEARLDAMEGAISNASPATNGGFGVGSVNPAWYRTRYKFDSFNDSGGTIYPGASDFASGYIAGAVYATSPDGSYHWADPGTEINIQLRLGLKNTTGSTITVNWNLPVCDNGCQGIFNGTQFMSHTSSAGGSANLSGTFTIGAGVSAVLELYYYNASTGSTYDPSNQGVFLFDMDALLQTGMQFYDPGL